MAGKKVSQGLRNFFKKNFKKNKKKQNGGNFSSPFPHKYPCMFLKNGDILYVVSQ